MAGLIISDSLIKKFGGSLGNANENIELPYSVKIEPVKIESVENSSKKRKHTEDWNKLSNFKYLISEFKIFRIPGTYILTKYKYYIKQKKLSKENSIFLSTQYNFHYSVKRTFLKHY